VCVCVCARARVPVSDAQESTCKSANSWLHTHFKEGSHNDVIYFIFFIFLPGIDLHEGELLVAFKEGSHGWYLGARGRVLILGSEGACINTWERGTNSSLQTKLVSTTETGRSSRT
jgi:hypothetical protein